ncbi:MAG: hypothetical protein AABW88_04285 [Nanoarchaeota archaeon]
MNTITKTRTEVKPNVKTPLIYGNLIEFDPDRFYVGQNLEGGLFTIEVFDCQKNETGKLGKIVKLVYESPDRKQYSAYLLPDNTGIRAIKHYDKDSKYSDKLEPIRVDNEMPEGVIAGRHATKETIDQTVHKIMKSQRELLRGRVTRMNNQLRKNEFKGLPREIKDLISPYGYLG